MAECKYFCPGFIVVIIIIECQHRMFGGTKRLLDLSKPGGTCTNLIVHTVVI